MSTYIPPLNDANFLLNNLIEFDKICDQLNLDDDVNSELAKVVLEEAGKLASDVLFPLNKKGDQLGASLINNQVQESEGFSEAYSQYIDSGWATLTAPEEYGGQSLPNVLGTAVNELWHSANMSFALCPMLSQGAVEALIAHGDDKLKEQYLPKLVSGEWTGTMNLTEPNAGSDLAAVSTKAIPEDDHYKIIGQKIYITWGDHTMTPNIVHLVLARLPDAPKGVKGISLFIVPKYLLSQDGQIGELNDVKCISLEHKLGIHGSPTCALSFGDDGGAIGYLVGEPHKGLSYMFTMMNHARQSVGLQGLSISEIAYQQALNYSRERTQGTKKDGSKIPIIDYPDVRRMLMSMKSGNEAMRALVYTAASEMDKMLIKNISVESSVNAELLTPIVKGWMTELAQELTSLNIQIHGGMGYVEETGAAQYYRDARILTIYEGTTGVQALDLIGRKTLKDKGVAIQKLYQKIQMTVEKMLNANDLRANYIGEKLQHALTKSQSATNEILVNAANDNETIGNISFDNLMMMGYLCGGWLLAESSLIAINLLSEDGEYSRSFLNEKISTTEFYADYYFPRISKHSEIILNGLRSNFSLDLNS